MLKKLLSILFVMALLLTTVSFGPALAEEAVTDPWNIVAADVTGNLTVYRYYADADKDNLDYAIEKMQEKYPNLTINVEARIGSDGEALRSWAAVGELPDIFEVNTQDVYDLLKDNGDLYVLDDVVEATHFYDLFSNGAAAKAARTNADGHQYSFGCEASNLGGLWYNTELFASLGISEPTNYEEFKNVIQILKDAGKTPLSLFSAEKWPATTLYSYACIAEGVDAGIDPISTGDAKITDEAYVKGAEKFLEIANMGAFSSSALTTNYQQAYEAVYNQEAGFFLSGAWFFLGLEGDGMGETIQWCKYNPFADPEVAEDRRYHAFGGVQTEMKYSVNTNPPSGLDSETVAILGMEMEWWSRVSAGVNGVMTTAIGNFTFSGSTGYKEYFDLYGNYETFSNFTGDLGNAEFLNAIDNACELVVSGNITTAEDFINDLAEQGY